MTDKEKILKIQQDKQLNNTQFSSMIGISPGTLSHIISGRTSPTLSILRSVKSVFPDVNPNWLFYDEEPMYLEDASAPSASSDVSSDGFMNEAPLANNDPYQQDLFSQPQATAHGQRNSAQSGSSSFARTEPSANVVGATMLVSDIVNETVKQLQRPQRKVMEVRIFFDDGTFECFANN